MFAGSKCASPWRGSVCVSRRSGGTAASFALQIQAYTAFLLLYHPSVTASRDSSPPRGAKGTTVFHSALNSCLAYSESRRIFRFASANPRPPYGAEGKYSSAQRLFALCRRARIYRFFHRTGLVSVAVLAASFHSTAAPRASAMARTGR